MPNARSTEVDSLGVINLIGSNLIDRYSPRSILKELLQNADDAGARTVVIGWTPSPGEVASHQLLRGPALFVVNDGTFTRRDAEAINRFGQNYKSGEKSVIGKFGLGLKSVFHLCEAFFYLSSKPPDDEGLFNNLASPWAKTDYDRGWNSVRVEDLRLLHDFLRPICPPPGDDWFALWLPLRKKAYCGASRFGPRNDGDHPTCPPELLDGLTERGMARALPLLHSVNTIRIWRRWEPGSTGSPAELHLAPDSGRSLFKEYVTYVEKTVRGGGTPDCFHARFEQSRRCHAGRYETAGTACPSSVAYALVQTWSADLLPLTTQEDWPKSFVLSGGQQPDKAQPHAAVVLGHRPEMSDGRLDAAVAVFLPLEATEPAGASRHHPECEFLLTLHGCFFVDSGRNAPYDGQGVRGNWNRRLMSGGVLPLLIPALEALAGSDACNREVVHRLTKALASWLEHPEPAAPLVGDGAKEQVCRTHSWVLRWYPEGACWERCDSAATVLEIPDCGNEAVLPGRAMPRLGDVAREVVLTPAGSPRLTLKEPEIWGDEILARALDIADPRPLLEDGGLGLKYLSQFVCLHPPSKAAAIAALLQTLRKLFSSIRAGSLDEHKEVLVQIIHRVPAPLRRGLPLGGNWPDETRRGVCETGTTILLLPATFDPETDPGTAAVPTDHAIAALQLFAGAMSPGRNTNPAAALIRAAAHRAEVIEATHDLPLWAAQRLSGDTVETVVCTLCEFRADHNRHATFVGPANEWVRELAAAVGQELTVIPQESAAVLFPAGGLPQGDLAGALALLIESPQLRDVSSRAPLVQRLLATANPPGELLRRWCWGVRYLLHGVPDLPVGDDLYLASGAKEVWGRLAETVLGALGQPHRILPDNLLSRLLSPDHRSLLGIKALLPPEVAVLLDEIDLLSLDVQFTLAERDEILRGLEPFPGLIRQLPLHDRIGGGMTRISTACYWDGSGSPGTLAQHITLLRLCGHPVLAAIQREAHPQELTPVELVRLALRLGPAAHAEVILDAFSSVRELPAELRQQFADLRTPLAGAKWLPLHGGGLVAPADVLHDERLGDAVVDALRIITAVPGDPVPSAELSRQVRDHAAFRDLARQMFPPREQLVGRLAGVLRRDTRFRIGSVDLRTPEERDEWLEAFRDAPVTVMAARDLIARVDAVDRQLCVGRLLPPLREGTLPPDRLERILGFLRDRHVRGEGARPVIVRMHNLYLRLAAADRGTFTSLLPRLRLLNEAGEWADPATLCVAPGIDWANTLGAEQQEVLKDCVSRKPTPQEFLHGKFGDQGTDARIGERHFAESVEQFREYFKAWRDEEELAGWAGALLALLGDYDPLQALADEFLGIASPGRKVWYVRTKAGMRDAQLITRSATRLESPSEMMKRQRVLFRWADPTRPLTVTNVLGTPITVAARLQFDTLLIGYGLDQIECPHLGNLRVSCLHLRKINPATVPRRTLSELVRRTGELVLRVYFGQLESQLEFAEILKEFSGDDAFGVRVAQESFLNGAQYALPYLGLRATQNRQLHDLLKLADAAASRRAEENAMPDRYLPGETAGTLERVFREELQKHVSTCPDVQAELVAAVRRKVREFRYEPRSVLFELFQNADDAYAESGCPAGAAFVVQQTAQALAVCHNGRPINRSPGGDETGGHLHDLRKMLSLGHSDKGAGPAAGEVTGRFGLGFKSVFLLTDRPRVVSGRLAFEVFGGVYPRPLEPHLADGLRGQVEAVGLPRETGTLFALQTRQDVHLQDVVEPFRQLAHVLVVFGRRIRSIRCGAESVSWDEQVVITAGTARVAVGALRPFPGVDGDVRQAVVLRCGAFGDLLFGLDESGFIPVPGNAPSIWVTAPTTEYHDVGYLVNAPLDLDVGRCQVTWDAATNSDRLTDLGHAAGDALIALFDAGTEGLGASVPDDAVWRSLWQVVARTGKRQELRDRLMWGDLGAARRLYTERAALPTGLEAPAYGDLTTLGVVRTAVRGILDRKPEVFACVAAWEMFRRDHPPGSVVSQTRVGDQLPEPPAEIDLVSLVRAELERPTVDPNHAERLGHLFTRERLSAWNDVSDEVGAIREALGVAQFRHSRNGWAEPKHLLAGTAGTEEALRAAFAPGDRVLSPVYRGAAVEFFLACRGPMDADTGVLAEWVLGADNEHRRNAALRYLERGELGTQVRRKLHDRGIAGTWLCHLTQEQMDEAGLDEYEQDVLAAGLGRSPVRSHEGDGALLRPTTDAAQVFGQVAAWWRRQDGQLLRQYNERIYPDGRVPDLAEHGPGEDVDKRVEWLKLFVTGIVQTVGHVTSDQNRTFIRLCESERWFATLADSHHGPREWLAAVERYIDRHHADGIRYFHWLRHFVGVATVSRHLDAYVESFLAVDRFEGRFTPRDVTTTRTSRQFQFGGPDAPTLTPILGIGACFVLRELARMGLVSRGDVHPYCFAPVRRLRQFLERLGWCDDENGTVHDRSRSIYEFVAMHHPQDPIFGNAFDIPLLLYAEEHPVILDTRPSRDSGEWVTLWDGRRVPLR